VTRDQFGPFLGEGNAEPPPWWSHPAFSTPDQPVVGISWFDAVAFGAWLSSRLGAVVRLPSEAEWERAARGGLESGSTSWGETVPRGEIPEERLDGPWRVGRGSPNGYGLLDIGTIVHEWCSDFYNPDYYAVSPSFDPHGPSEGERRASRGGSWRHHVRFSSPAARSSLLPGLRYADYGFRLVREVTS
jgi:formylglycine-generating enzyme required for sulfatase activity